MAQEIIPLATLENNIDSFIVFHVLETALKYIHKATHSIYLRHVCNSTVAETCLGDELVGPDRAIPIALKTN